MNKNAITHGQNAILAQALTELVAKYGQTTDGPVRNFEQTHNGVAIYHAPNVNPVALTIKHMIDSLVAINDVLDITAAFIVQRTAWGRTEFFFTVLPDETPAPAPAPVLDGAPDMLAIVKLVADLRAYSMNAGVYLELGAHGLYFEANGAKTLESAALAARSFLLEGAESVLEPGNFVWFRQALETVEASTILGAGYFSNVKANSDEPSV